MRLSEKLAMLEAAERKPAREDAPVPEQRRKPPKTKASTTWSDAKRTVRARVMGEIAPKMTGGKAPRGAALEREVKAAVDRALKSQEARVSPVERQKFIDEVISDILGYGPLDGPLNDPSVTEIMCNAFDEIFIERNGLIQTTDLAFADDEQYRQVIEKIVAAVGRRVDESSPMVDARLPNGSRVNAIIPPLALHGPVLTIRKFAETPYTVKDLITFGSLTMDLATVLEACVRGKLNVLVSGGTGTGKTTLLNVLSSFIPEHERIITIEDSAELQLQQPHVVNLESRPPNAEGRGEVRIRDLVRNALRMRPDRIVVGEVRGAEALDMLQAMNTGHEGSLTTVHANGPRDALSRLETMVLMAGFELPVRAIREQIVSAINLIVQLERMPDGARRVTSVQEVQGLEGDTILLQEVFRYQAGLGNDGRDVGRIEPTGLRPRFAEKLAAARVDLPASVFAGARAAGRNVPAGNGRGMGLRRSR